MRAYFDSSAFAKRFVDEMGSDIVESICVRAQELGLSVLCVPEVISALNRRLRERLLTQNQYLQAKKSLLDEVRDVKIINLTASVVGSAIRVLEANPVRAMDALHIACALEWEADIFVSADTKQLAAAKKSGLKTKPT